MLAAAAVCLGLMVGGDILQGVQILLVGAGRATLVQAQAGQLNAGDVVIRVSGQCGAGFVEVTELNGVFPIGTLAANGNQGGTGGADNITPAGTNSAPAFTGTPFSSVINHTHGFTDVRGATTGGATTARGFTEGNDTSSTVTTQVTANPSGGVASITPAGTVAAPTFSGTQFDNRPAFRRVIFCAKN